MTLVKMFYPEFIFYFKIFLCAGHGPFSHLYEALIRTANPESKWTHEQSSLDMLDLIIESGLWWCFKTSKFKLNWLGYKINLSDYDLDENDLDFIKELIYGNKIPQTKTEDF